MNAIIKIYNNSKYVFSINIVEKIFFFIIFLLLARNLSIENYGIVTIFTFANLLGCFFELGFANYIQRESAANSVDLFDKLGSILFSRFLSFVIFISVLVLYFVNQEKSNVIILGTASFFFILNDVLSKVLFGRGNFDKVFFAVITSRIFGLIFFSVLVLFNFSLEVILLSIFFSSFIQFVSLFYALKKTGVNTSFKLIELKKILKIFQFSFPMGLGVFFVMLYDRIDILLMHKLIGTSAVSIYSVAYSFYKLPQIFSGAVLVPLYTDYSKKFVQNGNLKITDLKNPASVLLFSAIIIILVCIIASKFFILLLYGDAYIASSSFLLLLLIALPGLFFNNFTGVILNSIKLEKIAMYSALIGLILNIIINYYYLKSMGIYAAIIATIITEYSILTIQVLFIVKSKRVI